MSRIKKIRNLTDENREIILNVVFKESLEFGKKWMNPIDELTRKKFPKLNVKDIEEISNVIKSVRSDIFDKVASLYYEFTDKEKVDSALIKSKVTEYIVKSYPWMSSKNYGRAINQGLYYAWHG